MAVSTWIPQGTCHRQSHTGFDASWHRLTRLKRLYAVSLVFLWRSGLFSVTALGEQTWQPALNQQTCAWQIVTTHNRLDWMSLLFYRLSIVCEVGHDRVKWSLRFKPAWLDVAHKQLRISNTCSGTKSHNLGKDHNNGFICSHMYNFLYQVHFK